MTPRRTGLRPPTRAPSGPLVVLGSVAPTLVGFILVGVTLIGTASAGEPAASAPNLDTRRITQRITRRAAPASAPVDAFAPHTWTRPPPPPPAPPPVAPVVEPPPAPPQAPPLPFKYMGRLEEAAGTTRWYLLAGERLIVASAGDEIDGRYRLDGISADRPLVLRFTYLPLAQAQTLAIGAPP